MFRCLQILQMSDKYEKMRGNGDEIAQREVVEKRCKRKEGNASTTGGDRVLIGMECTKE